MSRFYAVLGAFMVGGLSAAAGLGLLALIIDKLGAVGGVGVCVLSGVLCAALSSRDSKNVPADLR
jgi:hypothetical protein